MSEVQSARRPLSCPPQACRTSRRPRCPGACPLPQQLFVLQSCLDAGEGPLEVFTGGLLVWFALPSRPKQHPPGPRRSPSRPSQTRCAPRGSCCPGCYPNPQTSALHPKPPAPPTFFFFFFFIIVTGPRRSLSLKLIEKRVYEPQIRARLGTTSHLCKVPHPTLIR